MWFKEQSVDLLHCFILCTCFGNILLQADIKPKVDGCNGLRYDLTVDIIDSIFRTYPAGTVDSCMVELAVWSSVLRVVCGALVWFVCCCIIYICEYYSTVIWCAVSHKILNRLQVQCRAVWASCSHRASGTKRYNL